LIVILKVTMIGMAFYPWRKCNLILTYILALR
jgi:hypothetical protein